MLVSRAEMTALEEAVFASGPDAESLMESVGQAMARTLWQDWRETQRPNVVAYVGRSHNGGDALVIARALHGRFTITDGRREEPGRHQLGAVDDLDAVSLERFQHRFDGLPGRGSLCGRARAASQDETDEGQSIFK